MSLKVRFQYATLNNLSVSIERLSDGLLYDFSTETFLAAPTSPLAILPEDKGIFIGRYKMTLDTSPVSFTDGDYVVTVHDTGAGNQVVAELGATIHAGDDGTVIPSRWSLDLPGAIAPPNTTAPTKTA